ncbi:MAG: S9 family peptidase [Sphingomonas sp.]|nr:S9 family peptidase [Sphingomonas sp.]
MRNSLCLVASVFAAIAAPAGAQVPKPAALVGDGIPAVPDELGAASRPYMEFRGAGFAGWNSADRSMLINTRFGNVSQLHTVAAPLAMRRQISFEVEPLGGRWSPSGDTLVVTKDRGGDEFYQLYTLGQGRLRLVTDGKSRNSLGSWSKDSRLVGYSSTRRNGTDTDLYVVDPRNPKSDRLVARVNGGGWNFADFAPGATRAAVINYQSITNSDPYILDVASGRLTPIGDHSKDISYGDGEFAADGTLWVTSDQGSDVLRLGTLDTRTGAFRPVGPRSRWEVEEFEISDDGRTIAFTLNEAGSSKLMLLDVASGTTREAVGLPAGQVYSLDFAPWGQLGFAMTSAKSPSDAYSLDPTNLKVTRWTQSETGGLDASANVEPELVEVKSFDGEAISGFLYRPDPRRFPGKRPLIVNIHGGPEGQSRPGFLGRNNYLINELGVAIFFPNVRGSSGYGKRFVALDNGPSLRENSVRDIGAFLTRFRTHPAIDANRLAVTGGSYGGYMCYASAIMYPDAFKGALCNVAISNFVTFLENTQSYRRDLRRVEYGDERDPAQRAKLMEISPLRRISEIRAPLFVVQGANDPRVPASEAEQIVKAVRSNGQDVWYLLGENEGHGFGKKENVDYLFWTTMMFWQRNLLAK